MLIPTIFLMLSSAGPADNFDAKLARKFCVAEAAEEHKDESSVEDCLVEQKAEHRRFLMLKGYVEPDMKGPVSQCSKRWTEDGIPDWNMMAFCANSQISGRRIFPLLRAEAPEALIPSIDHCLTESAEDNNANWSAAAECADEQFSGKRDFDLFSAQADEEQKQVFEECKERWAKDGVVDWSMAAFCAMNGNGDQTLTYSDKPPPPIEPVPPRKRNYVDDTEPLSPSAPPLALPQQISDPS